MLKIYFLSGLASDKRTFGFLDLAFCEAVFVEWLPPHIEETLPAYAKRMQAQIPEQNAIIVGLSFGGMLAVEMAKNNPGFKVILLSAPAVDSQLATWIKAMQFLPLHKLLADTVVHHGAEAIIKLCGITGQAQKELQHNIMTTTSGAFTRWAIGAIVSWQNKITPANIVHIHGTDDKLIPYRHINARYTIPHGGHLIVMDHPEIAGFIHEIIT